MKIRDLAFQNYRPEEIIPLFLNEKAISVVTAHAEMVYMAATHSEYLKPLSAADVILADGVGLVWGIHFLGKRITKCSGVEILNEIVEHHKDLPIYFWGATQENLERAIANLKQEGVTVVGGHTGYDFEAQAVLSDIRKSGAKLVLVGMGGSEKQLNIVNDIRDNVGVSAVTVGGVIDLCAGKFKRAPQIVQRLGLEWLWRMLSDPKRFRRLPHLLGFTSLVFKERFYR